VELACRGTAASRFIDSGQYQLDDPTTDTAVKPRDILQHMSKCKEYDVTIVLAKLEVSPNECPKCGLPHDGSEPTLTGWVTWCVSRMVTLSGLTLDGSHHCKTKFNGRPFATEAVNEDVEQDLCVLIAVPSGLQSIELISCRP
jgi:hypothetical protein